VNTEQRKWRHCTLNVPGNRRLMLVTAGSDGVGLKTHRRVVYHEWQHLDEWRVLESVKHLRSLEDFIEYSASVECKLNSPWVYGNHRIDPRHELNHGLSLPHSIHRVLSGTAPPMPSGQRGLTHDRFSSGRTAVVLALPQATHVWIL
jgi:hypothetical protein